MSVTIRIASSAEIPPSARVVVVIGRKAVLAASPLRGSLGVAEATWAAMLDSADGGDWGAAVGTWVETRRVVLGLLPEPCSRHNTPSRAWALPALVRSANGRSDAAVVIHLDDARHAVAAAGAVARAFPTYDARSGKKGERTVTVVLQAPEGPVAGPALDAHVDGVRLAARLVDTPAADLTTEAFVAEARDIAEKLGVAVEVVAGTALRDQGFGGLWGVGKAAAQPPALVVLRYFPAGSTRSVAWVGKGIVYDTGGLSLKPKTSMVSMKGDMGGAAAVLGAFLSAVRQGVGYGITAVLCLAENAIGPEALRPDDVITLKSGRTVEINNTDAEGRLVLADGLAWAARHAGADLLVDVATLTGAALVATGKVHAALYCNDEAVESAAVAAGREVGEPCFPLPYAPELFRKEFKSKVADMTNSVKDRSNAQSSCAGQFIANHLPEPAPRWLHVDIAGPSWDADKRGTGFGVGLLVALGTADPARQA